MFLADRIALMEGGRLVQLGSPVELYTRPADAFAASFFGEVNRLAGTVRGGAVATPVGRVPAPHLNDGARAEVLIRPEGAAAVIRPVGHRAHRGPGGGARLLGRTSLVHLSLRPAAAEDEPETVPLHIHARVPGQFLPQTRQFGVDRARCPPSLCLCGMIADPPRLGAGGGRHWAGRAFCHYPRPSAAFGDR